MTTAPTLIIGCVHVVDVIIVHFMIVKRSLTSNLCLPKEKTLFCGLVITSLFSTQKNAGLMCLFAL